MLRWVALASAVVCVVAFAGVIVSRPSMLPSQQEQSAERNNEHPKKEANKTLWDSWFPDALALYTLALVVFTAVLAFGGLYQLRALERAELISAEAAKAAKESADVARDAVRLAEKTAERQLRAYVFVESVEMITEGRIVRAVLSIKNSGQTPAYDLVVYVGISSRGSSDVFVPPKPDDIRLDKISVGPGMSISTSNQFEVPAENNELLAALDRGAAVVYVYGRINYSDAFKVPRNLSYRMRAAKLSNGSWHLAATPEGNTAN